MSPETCQKRYSFQDPSNKTISAKQSHIISSRKTLKSNELSNLSNSHKARCTVIQAEISGDKVQRKAGTEKPRQSLERGATISTNARPHNHQISNQKPLPHSRHQWPLHLTARSISGVNSHSPTATPSKATRQCPLQTNSVKRRHKECHKSSNREHR